MAESTGQAGLIESTCSMMMDWPNRGFRFNSNDDNLQQHYAWGNLF
jgi:hypothetical protein